MDVHYLLRKMPDPMFPFFKDRARDKRQTTVTVRTTQMGVAMLVIRDKESLQQISAKIKRLTLGKAANTIIGDAKRRGISGGERKRLAIGCELLSGPQLLLQACTRARMRTHARMHAYR